MLESLRMVLQDDAGRPVASYGGWRFVSLSRRMAKRLLSNKTVGRVAARATMHQIAAYERRLPLLWSVYARIPMDGTQSRGNLGEQERLLDSYYEFLAAHTSTYALRPTFSIIVPVYRPRLEFLSQALASVAAQVYPNWQLCVVDDCSGDTEVQRVLRDFQDRHPDKVSLRLLTENQGISGASNEALGLAHGDYCALLDHDDRLYPNALAEVVRHMNEVVGHGDDVPDILYSDERVIGEHGQHLNDPFLKPDWSPLMHLSVNYTTHLSVYRTDLLRRIGGFRQGFEGSQDHDLMLRAVEAADTGVGHIPAVLYQWRAHQESTAQSLEAKPHAAAAGVRAVREACERRGFPAQVRFEAATGHYRVDFDIAEPKPLVSIVIPTRNGVSLLRRCVQSIAGRTTYDNYEIVIVDNGSDDPAALQYLRDLEQTNRATVIKDDGYFNFGRLCNVGVDHARGEYVVLLNNDTEVLSPDWLEALVGLAQLPSCGAVGAKLLYADGHVQHAGVVGLGDVVAGHSGRGRGSDDPMYVHLINTVHEAIAVTAACMCIRKATYVEAGGLDERWVPNAYGDVDLCLRLRERGMFNVYTPYAVLHHLESPSRRGNIETFERGYMRRRWSDALLNDPYVNPNLIRGEWYTVDHRFARSEVPASYFDALLKEKTAPQGDNR